MTEKQIKEYVAIKVEMDALRTELNYLQDVINPQNIEGRLYNVREFFRIARKESTRCKDYTKSLQEAIESISYAHKERLQSILDNYTPLSIALRLDAVEKGDKPND